MGKHRTFLVLAVMTMLAVVGATLARQAAGARPARGVAPPAARKVRYARYEEVKGILEALRGSLPAELKSASGGAGAESAAAAEAAASAWEAWAKRRDAEIRARLEQGDADTLINLMLFGTSFTKQPRVTPEELFELAASGPAGSGTPSPALLAKGATLRARAEDLVRALATPGPNERLRFGRTLVERHGVSLGSESGRAAARQYLLDNLRRVLREQAGYQQTLAAARQLGNTSEEFAERSKLYKQRGLSLDTSLKPDYALEESLKEMKKRGLIAAGAQGSGIRRVAIVGPGLDFTDKDAGYDFYPPQTVQPFAVMDTLVRLGLARAEQLEVVTLDISPRVNEHIAAMRQRARRGVGYVVQLPRDTKREWKAELVEYWKKFGEQIGAATTPAPAPAGSGVAMRAVRVRAGAARRVEAVDLNIVLQRMDLKPGEEFDLVIATNVFVYYDTLEQCLAVGNVERMLRPGGFLLTNNVLLELPGSKMKSVDYLTVVYSEREDDGDHIVWYRREAR